MGAGRVAAPSRPVHAGSAAWRCLRGGQGLARAADGGCLGSGGGGGIAPSMDRAHHANLRRESHIPTPRRALRQQAAVGVGWRHGTGGGGGCDATAGAELASTHRAPGRQAAPLAADAAAAKLVLSAGRRLSARRAITAFNQ
jgi:hypothetical protein